MDDHRSNLESIFREVLRMHDPTDVVQQFLSDNPDILAPENKFDVAASGKCAPGMTKGAVQFLGTHVKRGLVISNHFEPDLPDDFEYQMSSHPVPDERSVAAAKSLIDFVSRSDDGTFLLFCTSGGTSSMVSLPARGITLREKSELSSTLMKNGIEIHDLNLVRSFFSGIKGGGLLRYIKSSKVVNLIISDVLDNDLSVIGSGMLIPRLIDPRRVVDVLLKFGEPYDCEIIKKCILMAKNAPSPVHDIERGVANYTIDSNRHFVDDFAALASKRGYKTIVLPQAVTGESDKAVEQFISCAWGLQHSDDRPLMLIAGAETGVVVRGTGVGGRNSEFATRAAPLLTGRNWYLLAAGTDGVDGTTSNAGALVDGKSFQKGMGLGLDHARMLANSDSGSWCEFTGSAIHTGNTGINLADIIALVMA